MVEAGSSCHTPLDLVKADKQSWFVPVPLGSRDQQEPCKPQALSGSSVTVGPFALRNGWCRDRYCDQILDQAGCVVLPLEEPGVACRCRS